MGSNPADRRAKVWNQLESTDARCRIVKLVILESNVFAAQEVEFPRAMVVVGRHATGKTTFLRLLEIAFGVEARDNLWPSRWSPADSYSIDARAWNAPVDPEVVDRLTAEDRSSLHARLTGTVELTVAGPRGVATRTVDLEWPQERRYSVWDDVRDRSVPEPWHLSSLHAFNGLLFLFQDYPFNRRGAEEVLHQYSASELEALRAILGRNMMRCGRITSITIAMTASR